jgi:dethiobiotin synthetase
VSYFVTGTDTGVGKTHTIVQILQRYRAAGRPAAGMKPICCGDRDDATRLLAAGSEGLTLDEINPVWLHTAAAPLVAARTEGYDLKPELILEAFTFLQERVPTVFVEGVGGWLVPITADFKVSDLARSLGLPVLLVAQNRLGCLNHTLLTLEGIRAAGLRCAAVVLNDFDGARDIAMTTNREVLEELCGVPVLAESGELQEALPDRLDALVGA